MAAPRPPVDARLARRSCATINSPDFTGSASSELMFIDVTALVQTPAVAWMAALRGSVQLVSGGERHVEQQRLAHRRPAAGPRLADDPPRRPPDYGGTLDGTGAANAAGHGPDYARSTVAAPSSGTSCGARQLRPWWLRWRRSARPPARARRLDQQARARARVISRPSAT